MIVRLLRSAQWHDAAPGDVSVEDRGLLLGDGVFETFVVTDGDIRHGAQHAARLKAACAALEIAFPDWTRVAEEAARLALPGRHVGRLTVTRGPGPRGLAPIANAVATIWLSLSPAAQPPRALALAVSRYKRSPSSLSAQHKTLSYADNAAARREAVAAGADMALMLTTGGHVSGGDCANIFAVSGSRLWTPSAECAIRCGVMRERVLALAGAQGLSVEEGRFALGDFEQADALFVTNSALGLVPVSRLGARAFSADHAIVGALRLAEAR
tara:strand:- start:366 stop:1175 length:810 start_codon:yes stop_codon:yes gene_type:complete